MKNTNPFPAHMQLRPNPKSNPAQGYLITGAHALIVCILLLMPIMVGCDKEEVGPVDIIPTVNVTLPVDPGEIGLVIDTREIFRKGYSAATASIVFEDGYSAFNRTLAIDPVLNVAILRIPNDSLSPEQKTKFGDGITTEITITDDQGQAIAVYQNFLVLDDSGIPLIIHTNLPFNRVPVFLQEGTVYYIQPEVINGDGNFPAGGVLHSVSPRLYDFKLPDATFNFKYYVEPASDSTWYILRADNSPQQVPTYYFILDEDIIDVNEDVNQAIQFVFEQTAEGWARIREATTSRYVTIVEGTGSTSDHRKGLQLIQGTFDRFRFISPSIEWAATDRGTTYQQPIMPPAQVDFAYEATILNCSSGNLTESVGLTKSRTSTRRRESKESFQLFASAGASFQLTTGAEIGTSIPVVGEVKGTVEFSSTFQFTTSVTSTEENTISSEYGEMTEVSRTRTLEVPPFTGVEVYDAVRTVRNARIPFTQVVRLMAAYGDGSALTGNAILTQLLFNSVHRPGAVPVTVGFDYVDISLRGDIGIDQLFEAETGAQEIPEPCE